MEKIKVGDYVRTVDGKIGIFDRYSSRPDTSYFKSPFNCFIKLKNRKTPLQCCREYIVKHNPNIIDLIEVGDYVNGSKVVEKDNNNILILTDGGQTCYIYIFENKGIKSIVTKEQFNSIAYRLEE